MSRGASPFFSACVIQYKLCCQRGGQQPLCEVLRAAKLIGVEPEPDRHSYCGSAMQSVKLIYRYAAIVRRQASQGCLDTERRIHRGLFPPCRSHVEECTSEGGGQIRMRSFEVHARAWLWPCWRSGLGRLRGHLGWGSMPPTIVCASAVLFKPGNVAPSSIPTACAISLPGEPDPGFRS